MLSAIGTLLYRSLGRHDAPTNAWSRTLHRILHAARRGLIACRDPIACMPVGGMPLRMHLSHNLPIYQRAWPLYYRTRILCVEVHGAASPCVKKFLSRERRDAVRKDGYL